jgi:hypothetical protein
MMRATLEKGEMKNIAIGALAVMVIGWIILAASLVIGPVWVLAVGLLLVLIGGVGAVVTTRRYKRKVGR